MGKIVAVFGDLPWSAKSLPFKNLTHANDELHYLESQENYASQKFDNAKISHCVVVQMDMLQHYKEKP